MAVLGLDHVELYVADLHQAAAQFAEQLGLVPTGRSKTPDETSPSTSISLRCGSTSIVLTAPYPGSERVAEFLDRHGEGVANICLRTSDAAGAFHDAVQGSGEAVEQPTRYFVNGESATVAAVRAFGDVVLTFVERSDQSTHCPFGFRPIGGRRSGNFSSPRIDCIDHLAVCLPAGDLIPTATYYTEALGFVRSFAERTSVGGQAMDSIVVQDEAGALVLTLLCQDPELAPGQIARFVEANDGAGVQHLAFRTPDVLSAVESMRGRGVSFLDIPPSYYQAMLDHPDTTGAERDEIERLGRLGVLRDRDPWGTILQVFTQSTHARGTLFYEFVERRGAKTFGSGNIRALYEAVGRSEPRQNPVNRTTAD